MPQYEATKLTQIGKVLTSFMEALFQILEEFEIKDLISALKDRTQELADNLRLLLTAMLKKQQLIILNVTEIIVGNFRRTVELVLEPYKPPTEGLTLKDVIKEILPIKKEGGIIDYRDDNLFNWFGDEPVKARKERIISYLYRFLKNLSHQQIITEAEHRKIYQCYDIIDAIKLAAQAIAKGEANISNNGIIIYLKNKYKGKFCRLNVYRHDVSNLNVRVHMVSLGHEWSAGDGACFRK